MTIYKILREPLKLYYPKLSKKNIKSEIEEVLNKVKLSELLNEYKFKNISHLSGGQKRRLAVARALISRPSFLVADEPTEGLDVSLQGGIIQLFRDIDIPMLIITHNYSVASALAQRIGIMYNGDIVEEIKDFTVNAIHPFTINLLKNIKLIEQQD